MYSLLLKQVTAWSSVLITNGIKLVLLVVHDRCPSSFHRPSWKKTWCLKKKILPEEIVMEQQTKLDHIASLVLTLVGLKMQNCWKYLSICFWLWLSNSPGLLTKSLFFSPPGPLFQTPALFLIPEPNNWRQQKCPKNILSKIRYFVINLQGKSCQNDTLRSVLIEVDKRKCDFQTVSVSTFTGTNTEVTSTAGAPVVVTV